MLITMCFQEHGLSIARGNLIGQSGNSRGVNVYLKNKVQNHSKLDNSVNNHKSKISEYVFSKARNEKRDNMLARHHDLDKLIITIKYYNKDSRYSRVSNLSQFMVCG